MVYAPKHLVLALGSVVDTSRMPGMAEHSLPMKNVADALALRHAVISRLERAVLESDPDERRALLTFAVVGGGFSGVETAWIVVRATWWLVITRPLGDTNEPEPPVSKRTLPRRTWSSQSLVGAPV